MGPVDRLVQRRQIRRATEQTLLTPLLDRHFGDNDDEPVTGPIYTGEWDGPGWDDRFDPPGFGPVGAPIAGTLAVGPIPRPWYRSKIAVVAAAVIAVVVSVVAVALRGSATAPEQSTTSVTSAPPAPTSPALSPSSVAPTAPVVPPAPPPPPPPPPQSVEQAPVVTGSNPSPRSQTPSETEKPQINVTRTPMSVTPPSVKPAPTATPGDAPRRSWAFF